MIAAQEVVRVAGFGTLGDLRKRLPKELQSAPFEEIHVHPYKAAIAAYFSGKRDALDSIPCRQEGSEFYHNVWRAMSTVKSGSTVSYKELALAAGNPAATRAAGTACGKNRLVLLIPCHRIVKSDGSIGSYLYGADIKECLLTLEGAH